MIERDGPQSSCSPAACPRSATCRCAPAAGSPMRCAGRGCEVDVRDLDAALIAALAGDPPRPSSRCCTAPPARTARAGRARARSGVPYVGAEPGPAGSRSTSRWPRRPCVARGRVRRPVGDAPRRRRSATGRPAGAEAPWLTRLACPLFVKPTRGGSAFGATVVRRADLPGGADGRASRYRDTALIEAYVDGMEVAWRCSRRPGHRARCQRRDRARRRALRLRRPLHRRCDRVLLPADLPPAVLRACERAAVLVHATLGLPTGHGRPGRRRRRASHGSSRSTSRPG